MINTGQAYAPVILLLTADSTKDVSVNSWLADNRFDTFEAMNVFEALEEASDFTVEKYHDIIFLKNSSTDEDLLIIKELLSDLDRGCCPPVMILSAGSAAQPEPNGEFIQFIQGDLTKICLELDRIFFKNVSQRIDA